MNNNNTALQNNELYLKGDLGTVNGNPITTIERRDGYCILTVSPKIPFEQIDLPKTEDAEFEILKNE
jgi:hypothetical protein